MYEKKNRKEEGKKDRYSRLVFISFSLPFSLICFYSGGFFFSRVVALYLWLLIILLVKQEWDNNRLRKFWPSFAIMNDKLAMSRHSCRRGLFLLIQRSWMHWASQGLTSISLNMLFMGVPSGSSSGKFLAIKASLTRLFLRGATLLPSLALPSHPPPDRCSKSTISLHFFTSIFAV